MRGKLVDNSPFLSLMVEDVYLQDPDKQPNLLTPQIEARSARKKKQLGLRLLVWFWFGCLSTVQKPLLANPICTPVAPKISPLQRWPLPAKNLRMRCENSRGEGDNDLGTSWPPKFWQSPFVLLMKRIQLRLVVCPNIYKILYIPGGWPDFFHPFIFQYVSRWAKIRAQLLSAKKQCQLRIIGRSQTSCM